MPLILPYPGPAATTAALTPPRPTRPAPPRPARPRAGPARPGPALARPRPAPPGPGLARAPPPPPRAARPPPRRPARPRRARPSQARRTPPRRPRRRRAADSQRLGDRYSLVSDRPRGDRVQRRPVRVGAGVPQPGRVPPGRPPAARPAGLDRRRRRGHRPGRLPLAPASTRSARPTGRSNTRPRPGPAPSWNATPGCAPRATRSCTSPGRRSPGPQPRSWTPSGWRSAGGSLLGSPPGRPGGP